METIFPIRELTMTRIIESPKELVFDTWTDPKHLTKWWAPKGFTNPICEADPRPGGAIYIDMKGPDGTIYPTHGKFIEIQKPGKIVLTTMAYETSPGIFELENIVTVTLEDLNGKTKMIVDVKVTKAGQGVTQALEGMNQGWNESLDKLVDFIAKLHV